MLTKRDTLFFSLGMLAWIGVSVYMTWRAVRGITGR